MGKLLCHFNITKDSHSFWKAMSQQNTTMANDNSQEKKVFVENVSKINFGISENQKTNQGLG